MPDIGVVDVDFFDCIPLAEARRQIWSSLEDIQVGTGLVKLEHSLGRVIACDIFCDENLPPFTRSSVDGYAVSSSDTFGAGEAAPALLHYVGEVVMWQLAQIPV